VDYHHTAPACSQNECHLRWSSQPSIPLLKPLISDPFSFAKRFSLHVWGTLKLCKSGPVQHLVGHGQVGNGSFAAFGCCQKPSSGISLGLGEIRPCELVRVVYNIHNHIIQYNLSIYQIYQISLSVCLSIYLSIHSIYSFYLFILYIHSIYSFYLFNISIHSIYSLYLFILSSHST
jgi:hypothetical protein